MAGTIADRTVKIFTLLPYLVLIVALDRQAKR